MKEWEDDLERAQNGGKPLSPAHPILYGSTDDNLRRPHKLDILLHSTPPDEDIQMEYSVGFHVFQLHCLEGSISRWKVGVATNESDGSNVWDSESYGWNIDKNECFHGFSQLGNNGWRYPVRSEVMGVEEHFEVGDTLYCILDMDEGYLAYATDEQYLGVAFRGLKGKTLRLVESADENCKITMDYLGGLKLTDEPSPCNCKGCTRIVISEYCKDCSAECVIDYEGTCRKDRSLSPSNASVLGSQEDNLRRPFQLDIILQSTPPDENIQELHAWNPNDRSKNFFVKDDDKFTVSRRADDIGFKDRISGKMGYSSGIHVWKLHCRECSLYGWEVGVATKEAQIDSGEPIGYDQESYGWSSSLGKCYHAFPTFTEWKFPVGLDEMEENDIYKVNKVDDKLYCILDMDEGYLAFATDEIYLGVAFRGLKGKVLYPIVSNDWPNEDVKMKYLGGLNLTDVPSPCNCKGCTHIVISEYCKDCSGECVIDQEGLCRKDLSPSQPNLHGSQEDILRRPPKLDILLHSSPPNENIQDRHAWNPTDRSSNISVKYDDKFTFCRKEGSISIDRIRGKGFHVWYLHSRNGSLGSLDVGVATGNSHVDSGIPNGFDQESYGWRISLKECHHGFPRSSEWKFPEGLEGITGGEDFKILDKLYCILDMDEGYLAFATDEQYLGVAFRGLKGKTLFPMVSSSIDCEVTMKYIGGLNLWDEPSSCLCKSCPHLIIGWYCKECSAECAIDHNEKGKGDVRGGEEKLDGDDDGKEENIHEMEERGNEVELEKKEDEDKIEEKEDEDEEKVMKKGCFRYPVKKVRNWLSK